MATGSESAVEHELGLRERKKQRTRETILRVASELFAERGFAGTTIRDIADAAEVSPRTVSAYFPVKEQLVFHDHEAVFGQLQDRLTHRRAGETAIAALRSWIGEVLSAMQRDIDLDAMRCRRELIESDPALRTYERGLQERFERIIAHAVADDLGLPPDDLIPHMVGAATMAALDALGREVKAADAVSPDELVPQMIGLVDQAMIFIGGGVEALGDQPERPAVDATGAAAAR
jgi:AcrR family transcriptional regulator